MSEFNKEITYLGYLLTDYLGVDVLCGMRNFDHAYFFGNFDAECSANYTLFEFRNPHWRIPQNTVSRYARQNAIVISRT